MSKGERKGRRERTMKETGERERRRDRGVKKRQRTMEREEGSEGYIDSFSKILGGCIKEREIDRNRRKAY